jgi:hypothetical protein
VLFHVMVAIKKSVSDVIDIAGGPSPTHAVLGCWWLFRKGMQVVDERRPEQG